MVHLPNEKNRNTCVVLCALHLEVLVQIVQLPIDHSISIEEIEEVHEPEDGHHVEIDLFDQRFFHRINLDHGAKLVEVLLIAVVFE